jgi:membrane protein YdbS with pleckstrin-like domain
MSYEKWCDDEMRKAQRQNRINLVKNEACIIALFAVVVLVYLVAEKEMWWLLCGGAFFLAVCVFTYSLCFVAGRADERLGYQEWQQGDEK